MISVHMNFTCLYIERSIHKLHVCVYIHLPVNYLCVLFLGLYIITHIHLSIAIGKILKASRTLVQSLSYVNSVMVLC